MAGKIKWIAGIGITFIVVLIVVVYAILATYDFNNLKPQISRAVWDATGRELTIGGDIDLEIGLTPALVLTDIKFQNAPWSADPELVKVTRFEVQVALLPLLTGNIEVKRFILVEPYILIETDKHGKSNLSFEAPVEEAPAKDETQEGPAKLPALTFNRLEIQQGRLAYRDGKTNTTSIFMLNQLTASATGLNSPMEISLEGSFDKTDFDLTGTLGPLTALSNPEKTLDIDLTAKVLDTTVDLKGSGKIDLDKKPPFIEAALSVGKLDLRPLLHEEKKTEQAEATAGKPQHKPKQPVPANPTPAKKLFPTDPLPAEALKQADAILKIKSGPILAPKFAIQGLTADILLKSGRLQIKQLKASTGGGTLKGQITLQSQRKAVAMSVDLKAENLELGSMLKDLDITDVIEGNLDLNINIKGKGGSVAAIAADLDGHTSVIMDNGRINNKYLNLLGGDLRAGLFRLFNPDAEKTDYTLINCLVNRFDINNGIAETTVLVFDTDLMSVVGKGKIDLATERLDVSLKPVPKEGVGSDKLGKFSLSLGELSKPFKLSGTLAEPSLALDPKQAAVTIGKAVGGAVLFGPVGIAAALVSSDTSDAENPCLAAIEAAKTGVKIKGTQKDPEKKPVTEKTTDTIKEGIQGVEDALKNLFGR